MSFSGDRLGGSGQSANDGGYSQRFGNPSNSADFDKDEVMKQSGSGESSLFSSALSFLGNNKPDANDVDEGQLQQSHQQLYQQGGQNQQHDASSLGAGAAMQVFKMFTGGGGSSNASSGGSGGSGGSQSQMIAMAMKEASSLFDNQKQQGNVKSGTDKQSVINKAAQYALQMYLKKGLGGGSGGGLAGGLGGLLGGGSGSGGTSGGGGAGGLMDMASKFLK